MAGRRVIFMLLISAHSAARSRRSRPRNRVHTTRARRLVETGLTSTATAHQHEVLWVYRPLLQPPSRCRPRRRQPPRRNRTDHRSTVGRPPALPAIDARLDLQIDDAIVEHRVKGDAAREAACAAATRRRCRRRCIHLVLVGNRLWRRGRYRRRMDARCCEVGCVDGRLLGRLLRLPFLSCSSSSTGGATVSARVHDREGEPRANAAGANDENLSTERSSDDVEPPSDIAPRERRVAAYSASSVRASACTVRTTRRRFSTRERRDSHTPAH